MGIQISYPLVNQPVVYEDEDEEIDGRCVNVAKEIHEINLQYCKEMIEKREASKTARILLEEFESQRETKYREALNRFPEWTEEDISKLKLQFMVIDSDNDYLIKFDEFVSFLEEKEVEASTTEMEKYFYAVSNDMSGMIDFDNFLQLMYSMKKDGWNIQMTYSQLVSKLQSARSSGSEKAGVISKMNTFQQMCYKVF